MEMKATAVI